MLVVDVDHIAAHTVVLKGVHTFQNNASVEYSDLEVMQMLGRAVCYRPMLPFVD
jgi:replicative superfamily II helicase